MATPNLILNSGQLLLMQTGSVMGIAVSSGQWVNGEVKLASGLEEEYSEGDVVLFDPTGSISISFESDSYFITETSKIIYKENGGAP